MPLTLARLVAFCSNSSPKAKTSSSQWTGPAGLPCAEVWAHDISVLMIAICYKGTAHSILLR